MKVLDQLYAHFLKNGRIDTDSRKIQRNSIFFALKGEAFDGNLFAKKALESGASFAVVDDPKVADNPRCILVDDVLFFLQQFANYHRRQFDIPVISITGTNGKTTTKELISSVLSQAFRVTFTQGNFNNHIGVPLTLLSISKETEIAIIEMGANHMGEIAALCRIAEPTMGLITNVGSAHLEGFGSFENVIKTKTEMYRYIKSVQGKVFVNQNNSILFPYTEKIDRIIYSSNEDHQAAVGGEVCNKIGNLQLLLHLNKETQLCKTNIVGNYNLENILAASCVANYLGLNLNQIVKGIESYVPQNNRSQLLKRNNHLIILDAYNANPVSMKAAVDNFFHQEYNRGLLILGDMKELGVESDLEHRKLLSEVSSKSNIDVFAVGPEMFKFRNEFFFEFFENVDDLITFLKDEYKFQNDLILVKGSRGIQLEKCIDNF
ncbi:MAG: UDP-N-acetylmuramoyl-tripeptide--D-alanyl-D-alanine ligase [Bacteroidales bacterium]